MSRARILIPIQKEAHRISLPQAYGYAVELAGGIPLYAHDCDEETARELLFDGLLLAGGGDMDPNFYGQYTHPRTGDIDVSRDRMELALFHAYRSAGKPIFGICRGIQVLNVALGGTLHQHIPDTRLGAQIQHSEAGTRHAVVLQGTSFLTECLKAEMDDVIAVNSTHHQAIDRLGEGLRCVAKAPDGAIEAVQCGAIWGVQWHPEGMGVCMEGLFQGFVRACER